MSQNHFTHLVSLWLSNDRGLYAEVCAMALAAVEENNGNRDEAQRDLADSVETLINDIAPDCRGLFSDLMTSVLDAVDWFDVADAYIDEALDKWREEHADDDAVEAVDAAPTGWHRVDTLALGYAPNP